jgi:hypothetical protein
MRKVLIPGGYSLNVGNNLLLLILGDDVYLIIQCRPCQLQVKDHGILVAVRELDALDAVTPDLVRQF